MCPLRRVDLVIGVASPRGPRSGHPFSVTTRRVETDRFRSSAHPPLYAVTRQASGCAAQCPAPLADTVPDDQRLRIQVIGVIVAGGDDIDAC